MCTHFTTLTSQSPHTTRTLIAAKQKTLVRLYAAYAKNMSHSQSTSLSYNPTANHCGLCKTISRKLRSNQISVMRPVPKKYCTSDGGVDAGTVGTWRVQQLDFFWGGWTDGYEESSETVPVSKNFAPKTPNLAPGLDLMLQWTNQRLQLVDLSVIAQQSTKKHLN